MRLLLWTLIWLGNTGTNPSMPVVVFPEHIQQYPYFSSQYCSQHNIQSITITTSKKFEGRPIYQLSQYEVLEFSRNKHDLISKNIIFESLDDTLKTIIGWGDSHLPLRWLENTGARWLYRELQWANKFPELIRYDVYENRDASTSEALKQLGIAFEYERYWSPQSSGTKYLFDIHTEFGQRKGRLELSKKLQPTRFYYTSSDARKTQTFMYRYDEAGRIETLINGTRVTATEYRFKYDERGRVKGIKAYDGGVLEELTDYFYNDTGTLRSVLTTNVNTKEMTIKEFRYSFY